MVEFPVAPIITEPIAPELFDITMPSELVLDIPELTAIEPIFNGGNAPTGISFLYAAYGNTIQDTLDGNIENYFAYIVPSNIEALKWFEVKEQVIRKFPKVDDILASDALRGFTAPTGEAAAMLNANDITLRREFSSENFKQVTQHTELAMGLLGFAAKAVNTREELVFDSHQHIQAATLEVALQLAKDMSIAYQLDVEKYNADLLKWDIKVDLWRLNISRQLVLIEGYKENLRAASIHIRAKNALWELYEARVKWLVADANIQLVTLMKFVVENEIKLAELKKNAAEYDLYAARINANTALFRVYRAEITAELVKLEKYKIEVQVVIERVSAAKDLITNAKSFADSEIIKANANLESEQAKLSRAKESLDIAIILADEVAKEYDVDLTHFLGRLSDWSGESTSLFDSLDETESRDTKDQISDINNTGAEATDKVKVIDAAINIRNIATYARESKRTQANISASTNLEATLLHQIVGSG